MYVGEEGDGWRKNKRKKRRKSRRRKRKRKRRRRKKRKRKRRIRRPCLIDHFQVHSLGRAKCA